jgi:hypothetical protein
MILLNQKSMTPWLDLTAQAIIPSASPLIGQLQLKKKIKEEIQTFLPLAIL